MTAEMTFAAGVAALEAGRYADALAHFAPLAAQRPDDLNVLLALASAQLGAGDARAALQTANEARQKAPDAAWHVLAPAAALANDDAVFRACLDQLGRTSMQNALALGAFWTARLIEHGHFEAAARVQGELAAVAQDNYDVRLTQADVTLRMGDTDTAHAALAEALNIDDTRAEAHALMAQLQLQMGDLDAARQSALAAIARNPHAVPAYAALADIDASALDDEALRRLRVITRQHPSTPENRAAAGMTLAAALDARGAHDDAFMAIVTARQELKHADFQRGKPYRREDTEARLAAELRLFPSELLSGPARDARLGAGLIFIVGMPRSGSTLVDQALASHSHVASRGESRAFQFVRAQFDAELKQSITPDALIDKRRAQWDRLYRADAPAAATLVDKNLFNFWNVGLIARLFPAARVVLVRRDPIDVCFSIFKRAFIGDHSFANDLDDLAHYHRCFDRLADHWRTALPRSVLEVRYERLVQDFETGLRAILDHCALPFEAACLRFHETRRSVSTSSAAQVRQPIFTAGVGRSRPYAQHLKPLIAALERYRQD